MFEAFTKRYQLTRLFMYMTGLEIPSTMFLLTEIILVRLSVELVLLVKWMLGMMEYEGKEKIEVVDGIQVYRDFRPYIAYKNFIIISDQSIAYKYRLYYCVTYIKYYQNELSLILPVFLNLFEMTPTIFVISMLAAWVYVQAVVLFTDYNASFNCNNKELYEAINFHKNNNLSGGKNLFIKTLIFIVNTLNYHPSPLFRAYYFKRIKHYRKKGMKTNFILFLYDIFILNPYKVQPILYRQLERNI